jgi:polysaccharide export outer membrane protein
MGVSRRLKTASRLARDMEQVLTQYVRSPQVNVLVMTARSVFSEVKVVGQLRTPQNIPYRDGLTVLDAVVAAGGLANFAAGNRAKVVRTTNGKRVEIKIRIKDIMLYGKLQTNIALLPGDLLIVPESRF